MGRHHPDTDPHADSNTYSEPDADRDADAKPQREPDRFAVSDRLARRVAGADICIPAAIAKPVGLSGCHPVSDCKAFAVGVSDSRAVALGAESEINRVTEALSCSRGCHPRRVRRTHCPLLGMTSSKRTASSAGDSIPGYNIALMRRDFDTAIPPSSCVE